MKLTKFEVTSPITDSRGNIKGDIFEARDMKHAEELAREHYSRTTDIYHYDGFDFHNIVNLETRETLY